MEDGMAMVPIYQWLERKTIDDVRKIEAVIWDPTDSIATVFTTGQHQFQENLRTLLEEQNHLQDSDP